MKQENLRFFDSSVIKGTKLLCKTLNLPKKEKEITISKITKIAII